LQFLKKIEELPNIAMMNCVFETAAGNKGADTRLMDIFAVSRIIKEIAVKQCPVLYQGAIGKGDIAGLNRHPEALG